MRYLGVIPLLLALLGCSSGAKILGEGGLSIDEILAEPYQGPKARLVIGKIADHTGDGASSLEHQLKALAEEKEQLANTQMLSGIRDLLTTALFQTNRFILLERDGLENLLTEQIINAGEEEALKSLPATLEGADLLLVGAITEFDGAQSGGIAVPIPIRLSNHGDWGILDLQMRKAQIAMDMRLVDVRTGRVVFSIAVEGSQRKMGASMSSIYSFNHGHIKLPGLLSIFSNTPIEAAIMEMSRMAAAEMAVKTPEHYYRDHQTDGRQNGLQN